MKRFAQPVLSYYPLTYFTFEPKSELSVDDDGISDNV